MNKTSPARRVAQAGILTALSLVLLYMLYALPTMRLAILFILSLLPVALAYERRFADAALSFVAAATLSGLLFPAATWLLYAAFFGWYGIVREAVVTRLGRIKSWIVLLIVFNIAFLPLFFLSQELLLSFKIPQALIIPAAELAFVLFELLFGVCREYYLKQIRGHIFHS